MITSGKIWMNFRANLEIEVYFRKLNLGVDAWVKMTDTTDQMYLGFCKFDGSWQICFLKNGLTVPLKNAPMEIRLMAVGYFNAYKNIT